MLLEHLKEACHGFLPGLVRPVTAGEHRHYVNYVAEYFNMSNHQLRQYRAISSHSAAKVN